MEHHLHHDGGVSAGLRQRQRGPTRALTARHPIKPTLPRCHSAWQPNPGRGSTYRRGKTVQTTGATSPFSPAGFGNYFRDRCNEAGLPRCSAHGLRKAAARRLAEAGCTMHEIAAITGHASLSEVQRYTKAADQKRLALSAMEKAK
jgi:integrase